MPIKHIAEKDWKLFKKIYAIALDRFCQRVLDDCQAICNMHTESAHDRYGTLYSLIRERDKDMAMAFDNALSRSRAVLSLRLMVAYGVLSRDEVSEFSTDVQDQVESAWPDAQTDDS